MRFYKSEGIDYGIIIRAKPEPNSSNFWWVVAGCGRTASIAAQELLISPFGCERLVRALTTKEFFWKNLNLIAVIFKVKFNPDPSLAFIVPGIYDAAEFTDWNLGKKIELEFVDVLTKG